MTPPSIFASDGTLNHEKKKSDIAVQLQNCQQPREDQEDIQMSDVRKVIILMQWQLLTKLTSKRVASKPV